MYSKKKTEKKILPVKLTNKKKKGIEKIKHIMYACTKYSALIYYVWTRTELKYIILFVKCLTVCYAF